MVTARLGKRLVTTRNPCLARGHPGEDRYHLFCRARDVYAESEAKKHLLDNGAQLAERAGPHPYHEHSAELGQN